MTMRQVELEVIAPILGSFDHCAHCQVFLDAAGVGGAVHQQDLDAYPPELRAEFQALSDFLLGLESRYGAQLVIRVVDPGSLRGMWQAIRHRVRRYPTFIVDGAERITGLAPAEIDHAIRSHLRGAPGPHA